MQVFRLLAGRQTRRAVCTITAMPAARDERDEDDEGPFFDLEFPVPTDVSSESQATESGSESEDSACTELDFTISLLRSRSASPSYDQLFFSGAAPLVKFCASEPNNSNLHCKPNSRRSKLRVLSFGSKKLAFYARDSFSRSSNSARSARLFAAYGYGCSPAPEEEAEVEEKRPSGDVIRRYLSKISRRLWWVGPSANETKAFRLRKSRSASASAVLRSPPRRDDSLLEKQDGIASAIAHCKESLHRASVSEPDSSSLLRSRSDPGKCDAA